MSFYEGNLNQDPPDSFTGGERFSWGTFWNTAHLRIRILKEGGMDLICMHVCVTSLVCVCDMYLQKVECNYKLLWYNIRVLLTN